MKSEKLTRVCFISCVAIILSLFSSISMVAEVFENRNIEKWTIDTKGIVYEGERYNSALRRTLVSFSDQKNGQLSRLSSNGLYVEDFNVLYPYSAVHTTIVNPNGISLSNGSNNFYIYVNLSGDLCVDSGDGEIIIAKGNK